MKDEKMYKNINEFIDYLKFERKMSVNTCESYRYNLYKCANHYDKDITFLDENDIRSYLYQANRSSKTISHYITAFKEFYYYLQDRNVISINPCENIKSPKYSKLLPKFLTVEEVFKLLNINLRNPIDYRNKAMLELLYGTGIRISELLDLKIYNIYAEESVIKVMGKGSKERIIPINDVTLNYLNDYINNYRSYFIKDKETDLVFLNYKGLKMSRQGFFKILKQLCEINNINKEISPHTIRHSFATHLLNNGADLRIIQELLGHENITTTEIYTHISNKKVKDDYKNHPHYEN